MHGPVYANIIVKGLTSQSSMAFIVTCIVLLSIGYLLLESNLGDYQTPPWVNLARRAYNHRYNNVRIYKRPYITASDCCIR